VRLGAHHPKRSRSEGPLAARVQPGRVNFDAVATVDEKHNFVEGSGRRLSSAVRQERFAGLSPDRELLPEFDGRVIMGSIPEGQAHEFTNADDMYHIAMIA